MTIKLEIKPETEQALTRQAAANGLEVGTYAASLLEAAGSRPLEVDASGSTALDLIEFFAPLRGLNLERDPDTGSDTIL